jgi:hypothetical protein
MTLGRALPHPRAARLGIIKTSVEARVDAPRSGRVLFSKPDWNQSLPTLEAPSWVFLEMRIVPFVFEDFGSRTRRLYR